jgi:hypothetical protein
VAEDLVHAALAMDRGEPLGNSLDAFNRRALHVKVGNKTGEAIPVNVVAGGGGTTIPVITNPVLTLANTEYPIALPANTKRLMLRCRNQRSVLKIAYTAGQSGLVYITLPGGCNYEDPNFYTACTLYVQSSDADVTLEVIAFT